MLTELAWLLYVLGEYEAYRSLSYLRLGLLPERYGRDDILEAEHAHWHEQ